MGSIPIGLQLFSVRGECKKDLAATLAAVADRLSCPATGEAAAPAYWA